MTTIMIVDDEPSILKALRRSFRGKNWQLITYDDPEEALNVAAIQEISLVVSDYRMPVMNGVTFLQEFKAIQPDTLRIILSGHAELDGVLQAVNLAEIYRFVTKPWNDLELMVTIETALKHREMMLENRRLAALVRKQQAQLDYHKLELERMEAESPGITQVNWDRDGSIIISEADC